MRTHTIDNTTIEYPDQIGFCFNPVIINILGGNYQSVTATVTDTTTATSDRENRATFGGSCFFDLSFYTQSYFDEYREVDYKSTHAEDSKLGRLFSIELDMYNESGTLENSFQFNVFILWGASKVGEQYNGSRVLTWFKNYPFSVGLYSATSGNVKVTIDGSESSGFKQITGAGGQLDFVLGAYLSKGGKSFICCSSTFTDRNGDMHSRIRPVLPSGSAVTATRACVQYVATEQGLVNLKGLSTWQRAEAIILSPDRLVMFSYAHVPWINKRQLLLEKSGLPDKKRHCFRENEKERILL